MNRRIWSLILLVLALTAVSGCQQHVQADRFTPNTAMEREVKVQVTVPDAGWTVEIDRIFIGSDRLHVISRLHRDPEMMAAQVISMVSHSVKVSAPEDLSVQHHVLGKTWDWTEEDHDFVANEPELEERLRGKTLVYERTRKSHP
jgi:hypothetical protein